MLKLDFIGSHRSFQFKKNIFERFFIDFYFQISVIDQLKNFKNALNADSNSNKKVYYRAL